MKLKTRLIVSFITMIALPFLLAGLIYYMVAVSKVRSGENAAGQLYFSNTVDQLAGYTDDDVRILEEWARTFPEKFLNKDIQNQVNDRLAKKNSYLVIRVGTKIDFDGASAGMHPKYNTLPYYGKLNNGDVLIVELQKERGILKEVNFGREPGKRGQAFVITPAGSVVRGAGRIAGYYALWVLVILLINGMVISMMLYRSIIKKVRQMQEATERIRQGDLETRVDVRGHDELSELAGSMERMRARLLSDAMQKVADEESQRKFLSSITHDLKTPLTSIIGYSEGILDGIADTPERQKRYVGTIHTKAVDMNALLNELSEFSKLDMHEIPYHFEKINAKSYFDEFGKSMVEEFSENGNEFRYEDSLDDKTQIVIDPDQIKRVLHNLVSNALKYCRVDERLQLKFTVSDAGDFIQASLEDNGKGISPDDVPHVFERLFRADKARNTGIRGSGIGLSIVKKIIEDHGGQIWVTSRLNEGSTFYFLLKKVSPDEETTDISD